MAELRPHYINVDLKKNTQYNVPVVTQNDTATHFIIRVTDDGLSDPELLDAYQEITMTSQRPDGESFYLTGTRIPGTNEIEFHLGTDETAFSGSVLASLQFYLVEDASRYTSAQFRYDVKKDLTKNYTPTQREETLVEVVLRDGPGVIQEAREAIQAADGAIGRLEEVTEENKTIFREPVATFAALSTTYPNPEHGTTVRVTSESATYRYSDGSWVKTDEYNPTAIDQVTAQLAETALQKDVEIVAEQIARTERNKADKTEVFAVDARINDFNDRVDRIIATPTTVSEQEIIDARDAEVSIGANIRKVKNALDYTLENKITNGNFEKGTEGWSVFASQYSFANDVFTIVNNAYNVYIGQPQKNIKQGHIYYFYLDVTNAANDINFYLSGQNNTVFGSSVIGRNAVKGSGILSTTLSANQNGTELRLYTQRDDTAINSTFRINEVMLIDLTQVFGAGKEPSAQKIEELLQKIGRVEGKRILTQREIIGFYNIEDHFKADILTMKNVLDFSITNDIQNGNFSNGMNSWSASENQYTFTDKEFTIIDKGSYNMYIWQAPKEIKKGHIYYFYFDVTNPLNDITFYLRSGSISTFGTSFNGLNARKGSGLLSVNIQASQNDNGFRIYTQRDDVNITTTFTINRISMIDLTSTFGAGREPTSEKMEELIRDVGMIEGSHTLSQKDTIKLFNIRETRDNTALEHKLAESSGKNQKLEEELNFFKSNARALLQLKTGKPSTTREILLRTSEKQRLILHLHKRENDGYDTKNDVYLPHAENDFSDIRISNDKGTVLSYRTLYRTSEFGIIADSRLSNRSSSYIFTDSSGRMYGTPNGKISFSEDEGKTWQAIPALSGFDLPAITLIAQDDTLYFDVGGILHRSPAPYEIYTQVLDTREGYTVTNILSSNMVQHPDGELLAGAYQLQRVIRIYRSTDNGLTWEPVYNQPETYQHVHSLYLDINQSPIAIYAGLDGGGGVLKTTNKGETWVDLRAQNPNMPQSTDFGVVYSDPSGYRLLGGETSIVGGYTLLKTTDDINFKPVLGVGNGAYNVRKLNGKLFAGATGAYAFQSAAVYVSEDEGDTWQTAYTTAPMNDTDGASDGFRYISHGLYEGADDYQIIAGIQSASRSPLRIKPGGAYAEIVVEVPEGSESLIIEDGYALGNEQPIHNDVSEAGDVLVKFNFNEGTDVIKESISGKFFKSAYEWVKDGKKLANIYPPIVDPTERQSILTKTLNGFELEPFDATQGITISFWYNPVHKVQSSSTKIELIKTDAGDSISIVDGLQLNFNDGEKFGFVNRLTLGGMNKIDIVLKAGGGGIVYTNGQLTIENESVNYSTALSTITNSSKVTLLKSVAHNDFDYMQNFSIRKGVVNAEKLYQEYNAFISDNMGD